ncbi:interleukin-5 receptor subunit alpha-like [Anolis sagrei]|uniref:interleukin-5 receptor subunit alpha-like n=1 Tax=Anolis sagrei TaxID=38937 RepID=UPI003520724C
MAANLQRIHIIWLIVLCSILHFAFPQENGTDRTSAQNFSCVVKSYIFKGPSMNCTWKAGKEAPKDTQYFLWLKYNTKEEIECPHYICDKLGRHIGCYFPNVTVNGDRVDLTVNGSSEESPIQPSSHNHQPYLLEKLGPPRNFTVNCQEQSSYCTVKWNPPPSSRGVPEHCFRYQIKDEIRNTYQNITEAASSKNYSKGVRQRLRIRTIKQITCPLTEEFGEWSEPIEFGADPNPFPLGLLVFVVAGTIIVSLVLILACKRSHAWKKIIAPIPQPKDIIKQYEKNMEKACMDSLLTTAEDEKITLVEEMTVKTYDLTDQQLNLRNYGNTIALRVHTASKMN